MLRWITAVLLVAFVGAQAYAVTPQAHTQKGAPAATCRAFAGAFVRLTTQNGRPFSVYFTGPPSAGLGILLLPSAAGLDESTLAWADRLGAQGYSVVAVNLNDTAHSSQSNTAQVLAPSQVDTEARAAIHFLSAPGRKVVTLGWGPDGALQSLEASAADPAEVSGTVLYNGGASAPASLVKRLKSLVLLIAFSTTTPLPKLQAFEVRMRRYHKPLMVHYYKVDPKAADPAGPDFDSAIAQQIWSDAQVFFHRVTRLCRRCAPYQSYLFDYHN